MNPVYLVTGATGFLGGRLCLELMRSGQVRAATLTCVVRGRTDGGARTRLLDYLRVLGGTDRELARITVVRGNTAMPRLGLSAADHARLARRVDAIYHCASTVNLAAPYQHLVPGNITATEHVVRFAQLGPQKTLHHVSTGFMFADARRAGHAEVSEATEPTQEMCGAVGYNRTKFDAERVVTDAASGGLPAVIYRPCLILGDGRTGHASDTELSVRMIRAAIAVGSAPSTPALVPVGPVDFVAEAIAALSLRPESIGRVYHPNLREPYPISAIFDHVRACGYDLARVDAPTWRRELLARTEVPSVTLALACWEAISYLVVASPRYLPPVAYSTVTHDALVRAGVREPEVGTPLFARILDRLARDGTIPLPRRKTA